ncbi:unnamed protein product [Acanthosepion pharaonis]|uniref:Uncharacterized protein n=1 Tax=Acanthosepion pharaonis TaxID=158019 RepID=A0A812AUF3_ACAPH|nr:unnamed protein product [Sepia pharaonis]
MSLIMMLMIITMSVFPLSSLHSFFLLPLPPSLPSPTPPLFFIPTDKISTEWSIIPTAADKYRVVLQSSLGLQPLLDLPVSLSVCLSTTFTTFFFFIIIFFFVFPYILLSILATPAPITTRHLHPMPISAKLPLLSTRPDHYILPNLLSISLHLSQFLDRFLVLSSWTSLSLFLSSPYFSLSLPLPLPPLSRHLLTTLTYH